MNAKRATATKAEALLADPEGASAIVRAFQLLSAVPYRNFPCSCPRHSTSKSFQQQIRLVSRRDLLGRRKARRAAILTVVVKKGGPAAE
ncbi:MAG: hypothetical protein C5B49_03395 [Bdellovibrio sp.]|nr:MAG: hypothetical protein C5B49_03395 [Bdellovibrio sp.]